MKISIVIPIYQSIENAEKELPEVIEYLKNKFREFELIFIIDNLFISDKVHALFDDKEYVSVYTLNKNYGQQFATLCGFYLAKGEYIVSVDEDVFEHIMQIDDHFNFNNYDAMYLYYDKKNMYQSKFRWFLSSIYKNILLQLAGLNSYSTSFRIIKSSLRDSILKQQHIYYNIEHCISLETKSIGVQRININDITDHNSSYNYSKLINIAFQFFLESSTFIFISILLFIPYFIFLAYTKQYIVVSSVYLAIISLCTIFYYWKRFKKPKLKTLIEGAILLK
ncbi:MAG TPA: glycosyltransferase [Chitinophagales bacterium]|jgi:hypothetical protein|nr:glycosyltransferase [Chitinophagales bacterium]MBP6153322.1 glycosyltransferase [Chitinophagales bacterium]HQV78418.1 glycosyltransferase [Chitinophagales bacterium]HQW78896.1 glycosyltransferase [Chitinophagales bacterium]